MNKNLVYDNYEDFKEGINKYLDFSLIKDLIPSEVTEFNIRLFNSKMELQNHLDENMEGSYIVLRGNLNSYVKGENPFVLILDGLDIKYDKVVIGGVVNE